MNKQLQHIGESHSPDRIQANTPTQVLSTMPLSNWRGSIATFNGFTGTKPVQELKYVTWDAIKEVIAPASPVILEDKSKDKFFVPCALKDAHLVGNTLDAAKSNSQPIIGKMRSKSHVTEASLLVIDVDGLSEEYLKAGLVKIKCDGLTYLAYTTHSHGRHDKPGMRVRLIVPLDRPLDITGYAAAWHGLDQLYFSGHAGKADSSGANMYQQQGIFCAHPDRANLAERWSEHGGIAASDALIANSGFPLTGCAGSDVSPNRPVKATQHHCSFYTDDYPPSDAYKIAEACQQIGEFRDTKGANQSEPLWFDCLGVVGFCMEGAEVSQVWSSGHHEYDSYKTEKKLVNRMRMPPTTCAQFMRSNLDGCIGCIQQCRSPITLGWDETFVAISSSGVKP